MVLTSTSYFNNVMMPAKYAHRGIYTGQNISPQFAWSEYPGDTRSFVLIMVDRHPKAKSWVHWLLTDIPVSVNKIVEGASHSSKMPEGIQELINTYGEMGYGGPQPPKGTGKHQYETTVYALNIDKTGLKGQMDESKVMAKIRPHILAQAVLNGYFIN